MKTPHVLHKQEFGAFLYLLFEQKIEHIITANKNPLFLARFSKIWIFYSPGMIYFCSGQPYVQMNLAEEKKV